MALQSLAARNSHRSSRSWRQPRQTATVPAKQRGMRAVEADRASVDRIAERRAAAAFRGLADEIGSRLVAAALPIRGRLVDGVGRR